jgi:hypothetical protein
MTKLTKSISKNGTLDAIWFFIEFLSPLHSNCGTLELTKLVVCIAC